MPERPASGTFASTFLLYERPNRAQPVGSPDPLLGPSFVPFLRFLSKTVRTHALSVELRLPAVIAQATGPKRLSSFLS
jgi:hypothetical protein